MKEQRKNAPAGEGPVERRVRRRRMTMREALLVLMDAASRDAQGAGLGIRSTSDEWRAKLAEAWAVAHRKAYGWEPDGSAYRNAGFSPPN
jgi:hypothetical protein